MRQGGKYLPVYGLWFMSLTLFKENKMKIAGHCDKTGSITSCTSDDPA